MRKWVALAGGWLRTGRLPLTRLKFPCGGGVGSARERPCAPGMARAPLPPPPLPTVKCNASPLPPLFSLSLLDSAPWPSARPPHATPPPGNEGSNSALLASTAPPSSAQRPARFSTCRGSGSRSIAPIPAAPERPPLEAVTEIVNSVALALSAFAYRRLSRSHGGPRAVPKVHPSFHTACFAMCGDGVAQNENEAVTGAAAVVKSYLPLFFSVPDTYSESISIFQRRVLH
jgi:hypothetical protein